MGADIKQKYRECVNKKRIRRFAEGPRLVKKEISVAAGDLESAKRGIENKEWKWCTIQAYYSMFHSARALLFAKGFNEHSHYCLRVAIEHHYTIETQQLSPDLIDAFQVAKTLRENADYEETFSDIGAIKLVKAAEKFLKEAKQILKIS